MAVGVGVGIKVEGNVRRCIQHLFTRWCPARCCCVEMEAPTGIQCLVLPARGRILASVNMDTVLWSANVPDSNFSFAVKRNITRLIDAAS